MRFREKLLIFLVAVIVSVLGFNLISLPFAGLHAIAKNAGNEMTERNLSECDDDADQTHHKVNKRFQITHLKPSSCNSEAERTFGANI